MTEFVAACMNCQTAPDPRLHCGKCHCCRIAPEPDRPVTTERDNCQVCKGARGGARGNENVIDGVVMRDACSTDVLHPGVTTERCTEPVDMTQTMRFRPVKTTAPCGKALPCEDHPPKVTTCAFVCMHGYGPCALPPNHAAPLHRRADGFTFEHCVMPGPPEDHPPKVTGAWTCSLCGAMNVASATECEGEYGGEPCQRNAPWRLPLDVAAVNLAPAEQTATEKGGDLPVMSEEFIIWWNTTYARTVSDQAKKDRVFVEVTNAAWNAATEQASARIRELTAALKEYGRHQEGCSGPFGYPCKCGWTEVEKLREVRRG